MNFRNSHPAQICFGFALILVPNLAMPEADPFRLDMCEDSRMTGWSFYCREPEPEPEQQPEPEPQNEVEPGPLVREAPAAAEEESDLPATDAMMAFRAYVDELKYRAVLDPTEENVRAYIEVQQAMIDQAGHFTDQWQRIIFESPELSATDDFPMAAAGIGVYQDQMKAARDATFQAVANEAGILFIFEDETRCGLCKVQGEVLAQMEEWYGVSILAVSKDGGANSYFPQAVIDEGQLDGFGLAEYPAPTMALVVPETGDIAVIGTGLLTADEILERVFVITEIPVGERY